MKITTTQFFKGFPESKKLFRGVREFMETLGPVQMQVMKTQISFGQRRKFAWAWLPQKWTANRSKESLVLSFALTEPLQDKRLAEVVRVGERKWMHHVVLQKATDLDSKIKRWVRAAYSQAL